MSRKVTEFEVKPEHLLLLKNMWVIHNYDEFGAPTVDPKRPYGNGDVLGDLEEFLPGRSEHELLKLHQELEIVLQIALATQKFAPGKYILRGYNQTKWVEKDHA